MSLKFLSRVYSAYYNDMALIIVSPERHGCGHFGFINAHKLVLIELVISDCSIVALHNRRLGPIIAGVAL